MSRKRTHDKLTGVAGAWRLGYSLVQGTMLRRRSTKGDDDHECQDQFPDFRR